MDLEHTDSKLFAGLAKVQQKLEQPSKDSVVDAGKYKYKFATLNEVIGAVQIAEAETGVSFSQNVNSNEDGSQSVTTMIFHEGGGFIVFDPVTIYATKKAQDAGSAISYARRYSLQTAFGIAAEEDDDGQIANDNYKPQQNNNGYQRPNSQGYSNNNQRNNGRQQGNSRQSQANQAASNDQAEIDKKIKQYQDQVAKTIKLINDVSRLTETSVNSVEREAFGRAKLNLDELQEWRKKGMTIEGFMKLQLAIIEIRNEWNKAIRGAGAK